MPLKGSLGEFEYLVLLSILRLNRDARAYDIRRFFQEHARRSVSRGALYATLDRLEGKGFLTWELDDPTPERGGVHKRRFLVTDAGLSAVRDSHRVISLLSEGLEQILG